MHETFTPVRVGHYTVPNRLVMAPMTRSCAQPDGTPGDLAAEYYAQRASVGLIVTEALNRRTMDKATSRRPAYTSPPISPGGRM